MKISSSDYRSFFRRGSLVSLLTNIIGICAALLTTTLLTRTLSPDSFGAYSYLFSWINVALIFCTLGFDLVLIRFLGVYFARKEWSQFWGLLSYSQKMTQLGTAPLCVIFLVWAWTKSQSNIAFSETLIAATLLLIVLGLNILRQATLRGTRHIFFARSPDLIVRPMIFAFLIWKLSESLSSPLTSAQAMILHCIAALVALVLGQMFIAWVYSAIPKITPSYASLGEWRSAALPLLSTAFLQVGINEIDIIMIGFMRPIEDVGYYSIAVRLSSVMLFVQQASNIIAAPLISQCYNEGEHSELQKLVTRIIRWTTTLSLPLFLCLLLGTPLIPIVFGSEYSASILPLVILLFGQLINVLTGPVGYLLTMTGHEQESFRILLKVLIIGILLNIPAIYFLGGEGAAIATAIAIGGRNIALWRTADRLLSIDSSILSLRR